GAGVPPARTFEHPVRIYGVAGCVTLGKNSSRRDTATSARDERAPRNSAVPVHIDAVTAAWLHASMKYPLLPFLALALGLAPFSTSAKTPDGKQKLVLVAGKPSHPPRMHEFNAGVQLLVKCLAQGAPNLK